MQPDKETSSWDRYVFEFQNDEGEWRRFTQADFTTDGQAIEWLNDIGDPTRWRVVHEVGTETSTVLVCTSGSQA